MKNSLLNGVMRKVLIVVICCVVALFSIFVVAKKATSPETYKNTIEPIDEKKATVIPFSLKISDLVYEANMSTVKELDSKVEGIDGAEDQKKDSGKTWWDKLKDKAKKGTSKVIDKTKELLNNFIDVIALFIIAYCAIPIIVFLVVIWFIKFLFNITIPIPSVDQLKLFHRKRMNTKLGDEIVNE